MRTVSFVDRIDFNFEGNVMNKALTIGDVDNDNVSCFFFVSQLLISTLLDSEMHALT